MIGNAKSSLFIQYPWARPTDMNVTKPEIIGNVVPSTARLMFLFLNAAALPIKANGRASKSKVADIRSQA